MQVATALRLVITRTVIFRLALGWGAVVAFAIIEPLLSERPPGPLLVSLLAAVIAVIFVCAFGVVAEAEHLARRLGDPYGTLILTLSIVLIEVILISAVMLGPGEHTTIARDAVMAASMIVLNLVIGIALVVAGMRHGASEPNQAGVSAYFSLLIVLGTLAFVLPEFIGTEGVYSSGQAVPIAALTVLLYVFFLYRQTTAQRADFQEVAASPPRPSASVGARDGAVTPSSATEGTYRSEVLVRAGTLLVTVVPIVLLSHDMAALLDDALGRIHAPAALSGILIAMVVFLPETITAVRAAHAGEIQRVSNLCHGGLVSAVGLTIPAVLTIGLLTGQTVVLAETPTNLMLLGVSLVLSIATFTGRKVTALHGAAHLAVFAIYGLGVFS